MINLVIKSKSMKKLHSIKEEFHYALTGSLAYVNSEIAICDNDAESFFLIIGNNNNCDITKEIDADNIEVSKL